MNCQTDQQLLREYAESRSEAAFAELARRHVDLVFSVAQRLVRDAHLAEDVTQEVFLAVARQARALAVRRVLSGWLHRTTHHLAANAIRSGVRRRAREQEAATMNELLGPEPDDPWQQIAPQLDTALQDLREADRDALLLRYFQRRSAREMALALGVNEEAAQKRVHRALERLRQLFAQRGLSVGASGLALALTANAVQGAPAGLVASVSAAAALAGTAAPVATVIAAPKVIAMTTLQKTLVVTALAALAGTAVYENRQVSHWRERSRALGQQQTALAGQIDQFTAARQEMEQLQQAAAEVPGLRGELARLQATARQSAQAAATLPPADDPFTQSLLALTARASELNHHLGQQPDKNIPELRFLKETDWLETARDADLASDAGVRKALANLRSLAKRRFGTMAAYALDSYIEANQGQLPADVAQLEPYFDEPTDDAILQRYRMLYSGPTNSLPPGATWVISEMAPVDRDYDSHLYVAPGGRSGCWGTGLGARGDPDETWASR